jgi:hypothetical protein
MKFLMMALILSFSVMAQSNGMGEQAETVAANYDGNQACSNPEVNDSAIPEDQNLGTGSAGSSQGAKATTEGN